jgi:SAM-dependent methyltransferase
MVELSAEKIASYALQGSNPAIELAQVNHRLRLLEVWDIQSGARVLEIGCGQGNTTTVLAEALGVTGHVDAVDPAPADYGAPFTLAQAQAHISASEVGSRITWHQADPLEFLKSTDQRWDVAIFSHCLWYFKDEQTLQSLLEALSSRVEAVAIAEYALIASEKSSIPHLLAAIARATLEAHKIDSHENIQSPFSPAEIKKVFGQSGWKVKSEKNVIPAADLSDGAWEAESVTNAHFLEEVKKIQNTRIEFVLKSSRDAVIAAVNSIGGRKNVRTMDVFACKIGA